MTPLSSGSWLLPRRRRLLDLWGQASSILGLNHRVLPAPTLLNLPLVGACRFLATPSLRAPSRWRGVRVRDLAGPAPPPIARLTRSACEDAAALGAFCQRLVADNATSIYRERTLEEAVVLRGTATPFLRISTRTARRMLERPRLAAVPISRYLRRWAPVVDVPSTSLASSSLRRCSFGGHAADIALRLALHALPHPGHPASSQPVCIACGSSDLSLAHRYWSCSAVRPLIREVFSIIGRPPDLQSWIFAVNLENHAITISSAANHAIYVFFVDREMRGISGDPLAIFHQTLQRWQRRHWANVLFSDESRFSLNTDSRRVFIWREPETRYHPSNIREIDGFRGGSLLVWAGISSNRRTPLHIFSGGTLTAQRYRDEILEPYLRPYKDQIGHNLILMDDNARPHRARLVNEYLQSENIRRMDWPARSPDLNPIEHVWDALGRRIGARHPSPRTLVELRTALLEEWGLLPLDLLQSLVNSMRARCETLIATHTPPHFFRGTLTAQRYRDEILEPYLRPYRDQIGHNLIFMDDNARPHRARLVNEYLQSENIRKMDWPARSPDLNPIEHVWDALGRRIGARYPSPRTLVELRTALLEEWGLLPLDLLQSLVNSMRARCETLIAVREEGAADRESSWCRREASSRVSGRPAGVLCAEKTWQSGGRSLSGDNGTCSKENGGDDRRGKLATGSGLRDRVDQQEEDGAKKDEEEPTRGGH
ncbi:hypothetical protein LAZ67_21001723 [Cordylochernes scorpioides]|uniref:Tc1-like transposase DDE domain-containing protein n=1 Tax=Cordylochernes scorpioides TaxID=51811 RepID=A0ABY6LMP8_9ARAC|nr:hypothetical protein LAZ67_21001723 [Cordylochernes scorpioides]